MPVDVTLLVSRNPHLIGTVRRAHDHLDSLRLEVCGQIEKAVARLHPDVVTVLIHVTKNGDRESLRHLLNDAAAHERATMAIVCDDEEAARETRPMIPAGAAAELCLCADMRKLIEWLTNSGRDLCAARINGAPLAGSRYTDLFQFGAQPEHGHRTQILRAATQDVTILLTGETGTGKTVLARQIHDASPRKNRPFLVVDCAALSTTLIESEIFGHVRGAYTGADKDRIGKFAAAGDGTLVLDEINSLPLGLQAKLLRVIEDRMFERLGDNRPCPVRARMIVISNVPLDEEVARERFRADLYHRLNVIGFRITPLRERCDAIIPLAQMFLADHPVARLHGISGIAPDALRALEGYKWPGNIRELRNVIERAVALGDDTSVRLADLPEAIRAGGGVGKSGPGSSGSLAPAARVANTCGNDEMRRISQALQKHGNNRVRAAIELRISRVTLYKKLHKYGFMPNGSVE
jgi:DNA-binding NtrC family response regulator